MSSMRRGYPLGALFVLVTACAVLVAGITPLVRLVAKGEAPAELAGGVVVGVGVGFILGSMLGLLQYNRALGFGLGAISGTLIGAASGGIAMLPASQVIPAAIAMTAGSCLIVGVAYLMRRATPS